MRMEWGTAELSDPLKSVRKGRASGYGISRKGTWKASQTRRAKHMLKAETRAFLRAHEAAEGHGPIARLLGHPTALACSEECCS